jgi:hypothetical protein
MRGGTGKAAIVAGHEDLQERIGGDGIVEASEAEFFDEPILERCVGALDAPFRLRAVRAEAVDAQVAERTAELREPGAALGPVAACS